MLLASDCEDCIAFTSAKIVVVKEVAGEELCYLESFTMDIGWI